MNYKDIFKRNVPGSVDVLEKATIGLAGCGGLGSNAAVMLARAGVGKLILADFDRVEVSNLNRQHFFINDIGKYKVDAIQEYIVNINPGICLELVRKRLEPDDIPVIFGSADVLIEAFDTAQSKKWLVEKWCTVLPNIPIICASGISGTGRSEDIKISKAGNLYMVGDQSTNADMGLCSSRVVIASAIQANLAIELILKKSGI